MDDAKVAVDNHQKLEGPADLFFSFFYCDRHYPAPSCLSVLLSPQPKKFHVFLVSGNKSD